MRKARIARQVYVKINSFRYSDIENKFQLPIYLKNIRHAICTSFFFQFSLSSFFWVSS